MTWNEFKKEVDRQLEEKGISGDVNIDWIDTSGFDTGSGKPDVRGDSDGIGIS